MTTTWFNTGKTILATGYAAIKYAEQNRKIQLNKYSDPISNWQEDISIDFARSVVDDDPHLIVAVYR
jgi:hypothetical protein